MATFPYSDAELEAAGLLGDGVSERTKQVLETMRLYPGILKLPLKALECLNLETELSESSGSPPLPISSSLNDGTLASSHSALSIANEATLFSEFAPSPLERASYYNGLTHDGSHPLLVYRSDYDTMPFKKPSGRYASLPIKSAHGVFNTPLSKVWITTSLHIVNIIKDRKINLVSVGTARFFTNPAEEEREGSLSPVVIWIGVKPGTTSPNTAHEASQEILAYLKNEGIEGVEVEWKESLLQKLAGPPLLQDP